MQQALLFQNKRMIAAAAPTELVEVVKVRSLSGGTSKKTSSQALEGANLDFAWSFEHKE